MTEPNDYNKHFELMADIDLSGYSYDRAVVASEVNDAKEGFQGSTFTDLFDGNAHNFRTKKARELRDQFFRKKYVNWT